LNDEWWLLERENKISVNINENRGYVPSNYVELITENLSNKSNKIKINDLKNGDFNNYSRNKIN
jgi:hypothetical protein